MNNNHEKDVSKQYGQEHSAEDYTVFIKIEHEEFEPSPTTDLKDIIKDEVKIMHNYDDIKMLMPNFSFKTNNEIKPSVDISKIPNDFTLTAVKDEKYIMPYVFASNSPQETQTFTIKTEDIETFPEDIGIKCEANKHDISETKPLVTDNVVASLKLCRFCDFKAENTVQLKLHTQICSNKKEVVDNRTSGVKDVSFVCNYCAYQATTKQNLVIHNIAKHLPRRRNLFKHGCNFCDERFSTKEHLREHTTNVHYGRNLPCQCTSRYTRSYEYKEEIGLAQCNLCNHKASLPYTLGKHMLEEHGRRYINYSCDHCGASFLNKPHLIAHFKTSHFKDNSFNYGHNYNGLPRKRRLRQQITNFDFVYNKYLKPEWKKNSTNKNKSNRNTEIQHYKCSFSPQEIYVPKAETKFEGVKSQHKSNRCKLKKNKTHSCKLCKFKTTSVAEFKLHKKRKHEMRPYFCKLCDCRYSFERELIEHIKSHIYGRK